MKKAELGHLVAHRIKATAPPAPLGTQPRERGATSLEYVFIASLISLVVFLVVYQIGDWVLKQLGNVANAL